MGGFMAMYFFDLEPIRSRWETGKLSYAAHVFRHGSMLKLLEVLVWFMVEEKILYIFLLIYLFWLFAMAWQIKKVLELSEARAGVLLGALAILGAGAVLPFSYQLSWTNFLASFALIFEFILIIRHVVQYQPGLKAPAHPR